ncbi:MAG: hypothetical protein ABIG08_00815 [bacterium]
MTQKTRTALFFAFLALFLLIAPSAVFYSQGYRIDFDLKKITQTGGLFMKIVPKQVEIYIDGKLKKKTDFFFGSTLIENLLPQKYKIEVKKQDYLTWEKTLEIKEKEVAEAKNIVLFSQDISFQPLLTNVKNFWFSPDQTKIITLEEDKSSSLPSLPSDENSIAEKGERGWALKLYELDKKIKSHLVEEKDISSKEADLLNLTFSEDSKDISLEVGTAEQVKYFTLTLDKLPVKLIGTKAPLPPAENSLTYQKVNNDIYYLNSSGHVFKNEEKLTKTPFPTKQETKYDLKIFNGFIFLTENENLYRLNANSGLFEEFFEGIKHLTASPSLKTLAFASNHEIWIFCLEETAGQPQRKTGKKTFLLRFSKEIKDVSWLNSDYLIINLEGDIKIAETDNRDKVQTWDIKNFSEPNIFFNQADKKLYILSEENLYSSEKIF